MNIDGKNFENRIFLDTSLHQLKVCLLLYFVGKKVLAKMLSDGSLVNACEIINDYLQDYRDLSIEKNFYKKNIWHIRNNTVVKQLLCDYFNLNSETNIKIGIFKKRTNTRTKKNTINSICKIKLQLCL